MQKALGWQAASWPGSGAPVQSGVGYCRKGVGMSVRFKAQGRGKRKGHDDTPGKGIKRTWLKLAEIGPP